ncbi:MAG TPA: acyl-CoA dehydrogenase family protein [Gemmatimonadaceae bacterium]|jgi:acyl-CoA dehydrogenase|nr:acyl-CoA dehydrogenase family protein [Gemmatimonadaceae bacterium]
MSDTTFLGWPFFDDTHRIFAKELRGWGCEALAKAETLGDGHAGDETLMTAESSSKGRNALDSACRTLVKQLGDGGWLRHVVPKAYGGVGETLDVRTLCLARETLASFSGLADFTFAMQGLGGGPIALFGSDALKQRYLPRIATGDAIAAFAISEAQAGSDVAAMRTTARREGEGYIIDGEKTWISNAGIADHYVVFCRLEGDDPKAYIALVVDAGTAGFEVTARIDVTAPHPLGTLTFQGCRVAADAVVGRPGKGLAVALGTLDVFRSTVGAAALGLARRALDEAIRHVTTRQAFGDPLSEFQLTRTKIADMATAIDASALLIYRAAWTRDTGAERITREAAMAKWYATEAAQRVIDHAIQLLGARGVVAGAPVEQLYREIRALRIYEGTSEIQQMVIASQVFANASQAKHLAI